MIGDLATPITVVGLPSTTLGDKSTTGVLDGILRLVQPVMPFVAESLWEALNEVAPERGLTTTEHAEANACVAKWPSYPAAWVDAGVEARFARMQELVRGVREVRILVSGDMDEFKIAELLEAGAPIDAFGVGTSLGVGGGSIEHGFLVHGEPEGLEALAPVHTRLAFERTVGDELQGVLDDPAALVTALESLLPPAYTAAVRFKAPLGLPSTVAFSSRPEDGGRAFSVRSASSGRPHLEGTVRPTVG